MAIFTLKLALALPVIGVITTSGVLLSAGIVLVVLAFFAPLAAGPAGWPKS